MAYLILQTTYAGIELGCAHAGTLIEQRIISKFQASSHLLPTIQELLNKHNVMLSNLEFIAANCGPGPFTTLRVALTTINGLTYATSLPLIGLNGLNEFLNENSNPQYHATIALFNAFGNDVYVGIQASNNISISCINIDELLKSIHQQYPRINIRFIGQAALMYKDKIKALFNDAAVFQEPLPEQCSLAYLSKQAYEAWNNKKISTQLMPIYLKNTINNITIV